MPSNKPNIMNKINAKLYEKKRINKHVYKIGSGLEEVKKEINGLEKKF